MRGIRDTQRVHADIRAEIRRGSALQPVRRLPHQNDIQSLVLCRLVRRHGKNLVCALRHREARSDHHLRSGNGDHRVRADGSDR